MNDKSVNNKTNVSGGSLYLDQEAEDTITIYLDDCEVECGIIASFPLDDKDYVALLPLEEVEGLSEDEILLYAYTKDGDELNLIEITDEDEFDRVADTFDEMLDDAAFNDL